jgi:hypothetical protein
LEGVHKLLELGTFFKRPFGGGVECPLGAGLDVFDGPFEIGGVVSAEIEAACRGHLAREQFEEGVLNEAPPVVPSLGPGIRKNHHNSCEPGPVGYEFKEFDCFRFDEMNMVETAFLCLQLRASDPVVDEIEADAELPGVLNGVGGEPMTVSAADFQQGSIEFLEQAAVLPEDILLPLLATKLLP